MDDKTKKIEEFMASLGLVKKNDESVDGFHIICKKCGSCNVKKYDDTGCGTRYTGCWGDAGLKCIDCGNASEIASF